ncbi:hypothetical protein [Methanolapillus ohkumae]|uniref:DUF4177 domain-containing protein n=1 Tax=Methanolapillus ohkumae TaxID=3028298 RepID=A0AA96ZVB2_9EURY|nr:hypothetical protein MsAm2_03020 [Methanosarcinaceae archaeon Am2]
MSLETEAGFFEIGNTEYQKHKKHPKNKNYESLLDYEYEMDVVDELDLVSQINTYAAQGWQFASVCGEFIIFKRPIHFMD